MPSLLPTAFALLAAASGVLASNSTCMPASTGEALATAYGDLIGLPFNTTLANNALTASFTDYSDSVIELIDSGCSGPVALGTATFNSSAAFIAGQSSQAPIPFEILNVWTACTSTTFRWRSSAPGTVVPEQIVTGIIVLETVPATVSNETEFDWQINVVYSEFNSGAWLYDLGVFVPSCNATTNTSTSARR